MEPYNPIELPKYELVDMSRILNDLIEANTKIGIYNEKLKNSKIRSELLLDLFTIKEALESSKIEGTQATFDEVLEFRTESKNATNDVNEVLNYYQALETGVSKLRSLPISSRLFKELHKILLSNGVRGTNKAPGEFRSVQNFIGPEGCNINTASFVPPEPQLVDKYMSNLEEFINDIDDKTNDLVRIAIIHSQFETIHPFLDGNGRIGRILIPIYLCDRGLLDGANLFISESLEKDKFKYYKLLNDTRIKIDYNNLKSIEKARTAYTNWIEFFIQACINEVNKSIDKIERINDLYEKTSQRALELVNSRKMESLINKMFEFPIFKTKNIEGIDISQATLNSYLKQLVDEGIIFSDNKRRDKNYYFYSLIDILR
ncbi:MAG: Fic family protein [Sarcina sp.]